MEMFLRAKQKKEETIGDLLDEELEKVESNQQQRKSAVTKKGKKTSTKENAVADTVVETIEDDENDHDILPEGTPVKEKQLPECFVRLQKTTKKMEGRDSKTTQEEHSANDDDDDNTDFKRTLKKNGSTPATEGRPPSKKKRLRHITDSD